MGMGGKQKEGRAGRGGRKERKDNGVGMRGKVRMGKWEERKEEGCARMNLCCVPFHISA